MTGQAKTIIHGLLKKFKKLQPFTIECITRDFLKEKDGLDWQNYHEIELQGMIEKYLQEHGLIDDYGTTKLYTISVKVNEL